MQLQEIKTTNMNFYADSGAANIYEMVRIHSQKKFFSLAIVL